MCDSLDELAESILDEQKRTSADGNASSSKSPEGSSPASQTGSIWADDGNSMPESLEAELSGNMGALRLEEGQVRFIGATSNLLLVPSGHGSEDEVEVESLAERYQRQQENPILSWTTVTKDPDLVVHLIVMHLLPQSKLSPY
jgi:hypothetical protein